MNRILIVLFGAALSCAFAESVLAVEFAKETILYSFCSQRNCTDGKWPRAGLIGVNGMLYGTTSEGGTLGGGTVFAIDPNTGAETYLHSFCGKHCRDDGR